MEAEVFVSSHPTLFSPGSEFPNNLAHGPPFGSPVSPKAEQSPLFLSLSPPQIQKCGSRVPALEVVDKGQQLVLPSTRSPGSKSRLELESH
jgi:hypothetical protein